MWTLEKLNSGVPEMSFADLGLFSATRQLASQGLDKFTFTIAHDIDEPQPYVFGDILIIRRDRTQHYGIPGNIRTVSFSGGNVAFIGMVDVPPRRARPNAEELSYELTGPWWYLDNLVYQQPWYIVTDPKHPVDSKLGGYQSHILMNNGINGARLHTDWQIWDAVHFAIGFQTVNKQEIRLGYPTDPEGARMLVPTIQNYTIKNPAGVDPPTINIGAGPDPVANFPAVEVPYSEGRDMTCGEVIRRQMKWSPDALTWFDYTTTHPVTGEPMATFHCERRATMQKYTLDLTDTARITQSIDLTRRDDLKVPAVVIKFERTNEQDGVQYRIVDVRCYPDYKADDPLKTPIPPGTADYLSLAGSYQRLFAALNITMDLQGSSVSTTHATIVTEPINAASIAWWKKKVKWLNDPRVNILTLSDPHRYLEDEPYLVESDLYPYEIMQGQFTPWMTVRDGELLVPAEAEREVISAQILYQVMVTDPQTQVVSLKDQPSEYIEHHSNSTTAVSGTYDTVLSVTLAEPVPENLAKDLWISTSVLQWSGTVQMVEEECSGMFPLPADPKHPVPIHPGMLLNIKYGNADWQTMDALVQGVIENIDSGTTTFQLGYATHLGPDDLIELLRINRLRVTNTSPAARATGVAQAQANDVTLGELNADRNGIGAITEYQKLKLLMPNGQFINLDAINRIIQLQNPPPTGATTRAGPPVIPITELTPENVKITADPAVSKVSSVELTTDIQKTLEPDMTSTLTPKFLVISVDNDNQATLYATALFLVGLGNTQCNIALDDLPPGEVAMFRKVNICVPDPNNPGNFLPGYVAYALMTEPKPGT
jgi:hypothetical protein